ncbi:MAG TPA: S8 family serine peptidase [Candidatus Polarisedimenticolaceae bacterium]|nr:S8 family serine peptidase [Candidatus Polarisedimenticolaceae bacterium]
MAPASCPLCGGRSTGDELTESRWLAPEVTERLAAEHPEWRRDDGACASCVQEALLQVLLHHGHNAFHSGVQSVWPIDPEAAFGAIPTPLRLHADPRFAGRGTTVAFVDAGFFPHPDLVEPRNRIRAWADASAPSVVAREFGPEERPAWPGWDAGRAGQWHGLMTTSAACGCGRLSRGFYRGLAPEARLVLVQVADADGRIGNAAIARALRWIEAQSTRLGIGVVSLSLGGDAVFRPEDDEVDTAVEALVHREMVVIAAAGNDGDRRLVPPASSPHAITVGGLDDRNEFGHDAWTIWHSNYGETFGNMPKPEIVAPSLRVVAPILPGSALADEAPALFARRGDPAAEATLAERKMVTPHYQHVDGTSFAAPIVAGIVATMLEANGSLGPRRVRELLQAAAHPVPGAPAERQGAGAVDAGRAVALALADLHSRRADFAASPLVEGASVRFLLHDHEAREVAVRGSWDGWRAPGTAATRIEKGLWEARLSELSHGRHSYKFILDGGRWLVDPANPARLTDDRGNWNSVFDYFPAT